MPRTRKAITISLDPDTLALIDAAAPNGNRSAAIKAFVHSGPAATEPQVSGLQVSGLQVGISEAGHAVVQRLATDSGKTVDEVVRLALRYATTYPQRWISEP